MLIEEVPYKQRILEAIERTIRLELASPITYLFKASLKREAPEMDTESYKQFIQYWKYWSYQLTMTPIQRATACATIHPETMTSFYQETIKNRMPLIQCLTIGDVVWDNRVAFEMTEDKLMKFIEVVKIDRHAVFPFHTWMTTVHLDVIDLCFKSWQYLQTNDPLDLFSEDGLLIIGQPERIKREKNIEFRPFLIGAKLIGETHSFHPMAYKMHQELESKYMSTFFMK